MSEQAYPYPKEQLTEDQAEQASYAAIHSEIAAQNKSRLRRARNYVLCIQDAEQQAAEILHCREDFVYWVENYVWIDNPYASGDSKIPMILYAFQAEAALQIIALCSDTVDTVRKHDILIEKTREMGWSWLMSVIAVWYFVFHGKGTLFGSRTREVADKLGDMKSLLEKCRYVIRELPEWMRDVCMPGFSLTKDMGEALIRNESRNVSISADAASPNFGRGDRKVFMVLDEFASWPFDDASAQSCAYATRVRIFISTPNGPFNKFARIRRGEDTPDRKCDCALVISSHWTQHPIKAAGLALDSRGRPTSPWYRSMCQGASTDEIAAELDIGYEHSTKGLVFPEYSRAFHSFPSLPVDRSKPIIRVWDPGIRGFFVLFMQIDSNRRVLALREYLDEDARIRNVAQAILEISDKEFQGFQFIDYGDPAGARMTNSAQEYPEFTLLAEEYGISVESNYMDHILPAMRVRSRISAISNKLLEVYGHLGSRGFLLDKDKCPILDRALIEGYRFKVDSRTKEVNPHVINEVHPYEDAVDCLGMGILAELGLATIQSGQSKYHTKIAKNVVRWNWGRRRREAGMH